MFKFDTLAAAKAETMYSPALAKIIDGDNSRIIGNKVGEENSELQIVGNSLADASVQVKVVVPEGFVDLGLDVYWAKWDLGATKEGEYGKYYAWGDTTGYGGEEVSGKFNSAWYAGLPASQISTDLSGDNDAATVALGEGYRMPTKAEFEALTALTKTVTEVNGVAGMRFSATNGNSIFIPFAGYANEGSVYVQGNGADVWSSSYGVTSYAWYLGCSRNGSADVGDDGDRYFGFSVRPVCEK